MLASMIGRRAFLVSGLAAAAASRARAMRRIPAPSGAPVARIVDVTDTYFGETLKDPYRWMENPNDPDWLPFLKGQDAHTRAILEKSPHRDAILRRIQELSGNVALTQSVQRAGGKTFFQQRPAGADNFMLFVREASGDRVLVDPTMLTKDGTHYSLDWWSASPDGTHVVYGLSKSGSEDSIARVLRVGDGSQLPEQIPDTQFAYPQWVSDGSGFFYIQLTGRPGTPERYQDNQARFHRLDTDPVEDPILMKRGFDPAIAIKPGQSPWITTHGTSPWVILSLVDIRQESARYVARLDEVIKGGATWSPVASAEDEVVGAFVLGDDLYLLSTRNAPRGRLLKTSANSPQLSSAAVAAAESELILEEAAPAKDGLYLRLLDGGVSRLQHVTGSGERQEIALPFEGAIGALFASTDEDGVLMTLSGWLTPTAIWSAGADGRVWDAAITPKASIDTSAYETKRLFATAKDGVKIPYSVIYRKGLKLNGRNPCWMSAYGAYGLSPYMPNFAGRTLALVDQGFIVGYASVRGGGEYGRAWHRAGQLDKKPNTWRDLIAVCEDLCARGWTRPSRLAIGGRSAGGITVGRAMTERPDLFAAVVGGVGWFNPLRYVVEPNGRAEEPEWGSIDDETGYRYLRAMDSYQSVEDGVAYPAALLTTGVTDPRVKPFHPAKMTARLQAATQSRRPVLLRVDFDAGHGFGSTREQQDTEAADTYAFLVREVAGG